MKGKKKVTKRATRTATAEKRGALIPLKKICAELGLDPKASRVRLRRAWRREEDPAVQFHSKGARWDLTPKEAKEVREILAG